MPSTHASLYYHLVFSTRDRKPTIAASWRSRLHAYMGGIIRSLGGKALAVGGTDDHVHLLVSLKPSHTLADVLRDLKGNSSRWVHEEIGNAAFAWQEGYGAFTVSARELEAVRSYIDRQEEHHRSRSFQDEYLDLLREFGVEYDERFLW